MEACAEFAVDFLPILLRLVMTEFAYVVNEIVDGGKEVFVEVFPAFGQCFGYGGS